MRDLKLNRRTILKGMGGAMLGLPALEAMTSQHARAADPPRRLVLIYGGISMDYLDRVVPENSGPGYDLKRAMLPLGAGAMPVNPGLGGQGYDVQKHTSIVSKLKIPWDTGSGVPPGGRSPEFHYNTMGPQLSGMRGNATRGELPNGPTADQIVADAMGNANPLSYRVQARSYVGNNSTGGTDGRISFRDNAGQIEAIDPTFSPQLAYSTLFGNFLPPDPADKAAAALRQRRHMSAIHLTRDRTQRLMSKLGKSDRIRLERHLDEIVALEARLAQIPPAGGSCEQPTDPGADPPVAGAAVEYNGQGGDGAGYSNEDLRASSLFDLISMAFACDISRVAAVRMTFSQSFLQMGDIVGQEGQIHELGHGHFDPGHADAIGWHVKHFARLLAKLRDLEEVDGGSVLDHTAVVLLFEGGLGYDPEGVRDDSVHSTENMIALVGGHAGGLNASGGAHIVTQEAHPAQVVLSAMNAVGVAEESEKLGEVSGKLDALFA